MASFRHLPIAGTIEGLITLESFCSSCFKKSLVEESPKKSFLTLPLPRQLRGSAQDLTEKRLRDVFSRAEDVTIVVKDYSPEAVALGTLGFSGATLDSLRVNLIVLFAEERGGKTDLEDFSNCGIVLQKRLGLLRWLGEKQLLSIRCPKGIPDKDYPFINELLEGASGGVLMTDSKKCSVFLSRTPIPGTTNTVELEYGFYWSYGDPRKRVDGAKSELEHFLKEADSARCVEFEEALARDLQRFPIPELPFTESFDETVPIAEGIRLYEHQTKAIDEWERMSWVGLFKMCTGAGKTISSLAAVWRLSARLREAGQNLPPVIVTVPTRVLADQWCHEIRKMGFDWPVQAYNSVAQWIEQLEAMLSFEQKDKPAFVVSTYCTFADSRFQHILKELQSDGHAAMWIADEMHNLASPRLLALMSERTSYLKYRLGLSATPEIEGNPDRTNRLLKFFGGIAATYELADGINDGVLCHYVYHPFPCYLNPELGQQYLELLQQIESNESKGRSDVNLYREKRDLVRKSGIQVDAFKELLPKILSNGKKLSHTLVYCPPGYGSKADIGGADTSDDTAEEETEERLLEKVGGALRSHDIEVSSILGTTPQIERERTLHDFISGRIQVVCAIGCLDEGVDVPSIERAIVLSSVNREKQFVQRRGRILRRSKNDANKIAEIYDIVVLPQGSTMPQSQAKKLLANELRRYRTFAELANNKEEAAETIQRALNIATGEEPPPEEPPPNTLIL
jgi:superfamily II DNA or RNA helicase